MIVFSILHATRGRPQKAAEAMKRWADRAERPSTVQYIVVADESDETRFDLIRACNDERRFGMFSYVDHPKEGSASAWDFGAKFSTGEILIQAQDDVEPPEQWDRLLLGRLITVEQPDVPLTRLPFFIAVSDGYRKDSLCCTAIMNRARYNQQREFLHAGYFSVFSDDEVTYRAYRDQRDGKCVVVEARNLIFLHRHHYHDKSVPMDATYERENSSEAYRIGAALFAARNPEAATDGLVTWR